MRLTDHEKAKRAKARDAARVLKYQRENFDRHYEQLVRAMRIVRIWDEEENLPVLLSATERKVLARLAPIQKIINADQDAKRKQQEKEERAAWKKDHPGRTLRDLDASLKGSGTEDAWMEWDMWLLRHNDPKYYAKLDAENAETSGELSGSKH